MHSISCFRAWARLFLVPTLFITGGAAALSAQTAVAPPTQLAPVVVPGRETDLVGSATSAAQGVIGARELEARPFLRRGELLEVIPGVVITQHSGGGKANQYFLRGFNLDHGTDFSVSVDGMPVNLRSHAHGQGYADLNFLIPELVRQVAYNKGPFYADVGDFSAAGAAEFRQFDELPRALASLTLGGNNYVRFVTACSRREGSGTTTGAFEFTHDDGPWALPEDFNRFNGLLRHGWSAGTATYAVTAMAYGGKWRSTDQIPLRAVEAGSLDRFGHVDPTDGGASERASVSFDATWKGDATTRLTAYAIYYGLNLFSNFSYFLDDPVDGDQFNQRDRRWLLGGALVRTWARGRSETTLGAQARADLIGELGLYRSAQRVRRGTVRADEVNEASLGVFAKNETRWNEWLRSEAGGRVDGYRFRVNSDDPRNSGTRLAAILSPKLGLVVGPWAKTEIYGNAGQGFHSNDARGTSIRVDPADGVTPADRVTPLVRSKGAEVGVRTSAVPGLVSSLSVWALDLDSELVFVGDAGGTEASDRTRRYGVELANFWRPQPGLVFDGDVAFTRARYREDAGAGTRIANSIATVVTAGATVEATAGWFGSVRLRYFGPQPLVEDGSVSAPSSITCNARVGWRAKDWDVAFELLNLFDRKNYDIAYYYPSRLRGEPAAGVDDIHFHPAEPRAIRLGVTRRF